MGLEVVDVLLLDGLLDGAEVCLQLRVEVLLVLLHCTLSYIISAGQLILHPDMGAISHDGLLLQNYPAEYGWVGLYLLAEQLPASLVSLLELLLLLLRVLLLFHLLPLLRSEPRDLLHRVLGNLGYLALSLRLALVLLLLQHARILLCVSQLGVGLAVGLVDPQGVVVARQHLLVSPICVTLLH